jgi:hypothetical protein
LALRRVAGLSPKVRPRLNTGIEFPHQYARARQSDGEYRNNGTSTRANRGTNHHQKVQICHVADLQIPPREAGVSGRARYWTFDFPDKYAREKSLN